MRLLLRDFLPLQYLILKLFTSKQLHSTTREEILRSRLTWAGGRKDETNKENHDGVEVSAKLHQSQTGTERLRLLRPELDPPLMAEPQAEQLVRELGLCKVQALQAHSLELGVAAGMGVFSLPREAGESPSVARESMTLLALRAFLTAA